MDEKSRSDNINFCKECGKQCFPKKNCGKHYCDQVCYQRYVRKLRVKKKYADRKCVECGDVFTPVRYNHIRCCRNCRYINQLNYQKKNKKRYHGRYYKPKYENRNCDFCSQKFKAKKITQRYCSQNCYNAARSRPRKPVAEIKFVESKRDIVEKDLTNSIYAAEIAAFKERGGQISVQESLPNPKHYTAIRKDSNEISDDELGTLNLDMYEDIVKLNNFIGEKNV